MEKVFTLRNADKFAQYAEYWESIAPQTDAEIFQRWLFAFTSIHTTWENNVNLYNSIKDFEQWINNSEVLMQRLIEGRAGLHNQRFINILSFSKKFWANPDAFKKTDLIDTDHHLTRGHFWSNVKQVTKIPWVPVYTITITFFISFSHNNVRRFLDYYIVDNNYSALDLGLLVFVVGLVSLISNGYVKIRNT